MSEKRDCKIIQDLLPNYIEKLTSEETNKYIEKHLEECSECKETLLNMEKELKLSETKREPREVKYMKKYSKKMRILKLIILLIFAILLILLTRKVIIISQLSKKAEISLTNTNYYSLNYYCDENQYTRIEEFVLNDNKKTVMTQITNEGEIIVKSVYYKKVDDNKYILDMYVESDEGKFAQLNMEYTTSANENILLYTENFLQLIYASIYANVKSTTFNGNECYFISNWIGINLSNMQEGIYIDKNTGLLLGTISHEIEYEDGSFDRWPESQYSYEFNTVTEADFVEPDINEYIINNLTF